MYPPTKAFAGDELPPVAPGQVALRNKLLLLVH